MKISLVLRPSRPLSRAEAWGCCTANLALPGSGSLVAGRAVGYFQIALYMVGFIISIVAGIGFIRWYLANSQRLNEPAADDPFAGLSAIGHALFWPGMGIGLSAVAIAWAALTSRQILKASSPELSPPKIT